MIFLFFFSSRRRHTRLQGDWSSDVCSSDLVSAVRSRPGALGSCSEQGSRSNGWRAEAGCCPAKSERARVRDASRALLRERRAARIVGGRKGYLGSRTRSPTPDPKRWPIASVVRVALLGARAGAYPPPREATRVPHPTMGAASDRRARVS